MLALIGLRSRDARDRRRAVRDGAGSRVRARGRRTGRHRASCTSRRARGASRSWCCSAWWRCCSWRAGSPAGRRCSADHVRSRLHKRLPSARYPSPVTPAQLSEALRAALVHAVDDGTFALDPAAIPATVHLERPRQRDHGDWATNVAMQLAKKAGTNPRAFAEELARRLAQTEGVATVEVAGPGFLNIRLDAAAAGELARSVVEQGGEYGQNETLAGVALNLEFVSANPTGPLHIGGVRWAAVGDSLARVLAGVRRDREPRVLLQRPRRADRPVLALAAGPRAGRAGARGRLRRRATSPRSRSRSSPTPSPPASPTRGRCRSTRRTRPSARAASS